MTTRTPTARTARPAPAASAPTARPRTAGLPSAALTHRPRLDARVLIDLSAAGVPATAATEVFDRNPQKADLAHLARLANASHDAGADLALLGHGFRLASGRKHAPDAWLDAAVAVRRLGASAVAAGVTPAVAVAAKDVDAAASLAGVARASGWAALDVRAAVDPFGVVDADGIAARLLPAVDAGLGPRGAEGAGRRPLLLTHAATPAQARLAGRYADVVRVTAADPAAVAALRLQVRDAAQEAGRDPGVVPVLADVRVVLSGDAAAARERVFLLDALADPDRERPLDAIGTVTDVHDRVVGWVRDGVCDGVVLVPGSLHTDTAATLQHLLPALAASGTFDPARATPAR